MKDAPKSKILEHLSTRRKLLITIHRLTANCYFCIAIHSLTPPFCVIQHNIIMSIFIKIIMVILGIARLI